MRPVRSQEPERDPAAHLAIDLRGPRGTVTIGGHDISDAVQNLTLRAGVEDLPELELDLVFLTAAATADGEAAARVIVPDATEQALIALGWKPPRPDLDGRDPDGFTPIDKLAYAYPDVAALVKQLAAATAEVSEQEQVIVALEHELNVRDMGRR